jgi:hypothetical protein
MNNDLVDIGLIGDAVAVAAICQEVGSGGALLVCNGCRNIEALIAGHRYARRGGFRLAPAHVNTGDQAPGHHPELDLPVSVPVRIPAMAILSEHSAPGLETDRARATSNSVNCFRRRATKSGAGHRQTVE